MSDRMNSLIRTATVLLFVFCLTGTMVHAQETGTGGAGAPSPVSEAVVPPSGPIVLYVAPTGNDQWSGTLPESKADQSDGPLASFAGARDVIRALREKSGGTLPGPVDVQFRGGIYLLKEPITLEAQDSGEVTKRITYRAYPGETPVFSGGVALGPWRQEGDAWVADLSSLEVKDWTFSSIFVNGQRRGRARTPNQGYFHTAGQAPATMNPDTGDKVTTSNIGFKYEGTDIKRWADMERAQVIVLHGWEMSQHRIASLDEDSRVVMFSNASVWPFESWGPRQRYYIENVFEAMDAPGEWYYNRDTQALYYKPMPGEDMTQAQVVAPKLDQLLSVTGTPNTGRFAQFIDFVGLSFQHMNYSVDREGYADPRASAGVPSAVTARALRFAKFESCTFTQIQGWALWLRAACSANIVEKCTFSDLGGGAVRIGERQRADDSLDVAHNTIDNNFIHGGGRVFTGSTAVWIGQSVFNRISHNEIADFYCTAVSVGWSWGKEDGFAYSNLVESNHIHDIGQGVLCNLAGVYVMGGAGASVIRNNFIHDVIPENYQFGGWGIHLDEGSSNIQVEGNVVANTGSGSFDQYYGDGNRVANNIFANSYTTLANLSLLREEDLMPVVFEYNILLTSSGLPFGVYWDLSKTWQDFNCFWDANEWPLDFGGITMEEWQAQGKDVHSVVTDPMFVDPANLDFRLKPESPLLKMGFSQIADHDFGLYGDPEWVALSKSAQWPTRALPEVFQTRLLSEDFESLEPGSMVPGITVYGANDKATVGVSTDTAASGSKSLKIQDTEGPQEAWQPELCYVPRLRDGLAVCSFDIRLGDSAYVQTDWRTDSTTRRVGPRIAFKPGGEVSCGQEGASEKTLTTIPVNEWVHIGIQCQLGKLAKKPATYTVTIAVPNREVQTFTDLPCIYPMFRTLERMWFLSASNQNTQYYLDNVKLEVK